MSMQAESATILIADPEGGENARLSTLLRGFGYRNIHLAADPAQAGAFYRESGADAVLIGLGSGKFDGAEAIRAVTAADGQVTHPILALVPAADAAIRRRAYSAGARDILARPFEDVELQARLRGIVELQMMRAEIADQSCNLEDAVRTQTALLTEAVAKAERANQAKSDFLARISHDIRTPLNAILGYAEIMAKELFGPYGNKKYKDYAATIHEAVLQAVGLTTDLMDLGRIEQDKLEVELKPTDVKKLLAESVELFRNQAEKAKVVLKMDIQANFPTLRTDPQRFKQIVFNLLSNAIKFTPAGRGVTVKAWNDPNQCCFVVVFSDAGVGIAPEDLDLVMQPYGQTQSARSAGGVGLGLPITKRLVELLGGNLELRSKVGIGTSVKLCFPTSLIVREAEDAA